MTLDSGARPRSSALPSSREVATEAAVLERIPLPSLLISVDGRIISANRAMSRCLALNASTLVGASLSAWVCEPKRLAEILELGRGRPRELRFHSGDGHERWLEVAIRRDSESTYLLTALDVTRRRIATQTLIEERERYLDMISAVSDSFWESRGASRSRIRIFVPRRDGGTLSLKTVASRWPDDIADPSYDPDGFATWQEKHERHEDYRDIIFRRLRNDGKEQYLRSSGVPWFKDGTFQGFRGVSIDVTPQVLAERALRQSQRHLEHAQRIAATGSSERDLRTGTEEWSSELFRILGVEPARFVRSDEAVLALIHNEDRARVRGDVIRSRSGIPTPPNEYRIVRPDGEIRTIYVERDVQCDDSGEPIRLLTVIKDVTQLRVAEQRQRDAERQLQHRQKLEALGTLAGGVAHELNNTLVPILALTKLMANRLPQESSERRNLEIVLGGAMRARDLVKQILAFSRKEAPMRHPIDLADVTRASLNMLRSTLPTTIKIEEHVEPVPALLGDPGQLGQVITNLVTNAAQAIGRHLGTVIVELKYKPKDSDGASLIYLSVRDTGCGMDEETKNRVFEPFFTTKSVGEGTGLGLSVVHGIVNEHGGSITVETAPGEGSHFCVLLPVSLIERDRTETYSHH